MHDRATPPPRQAPHWLARATLQAMEAACDRCRATGADAEAIAEAVAEVARAHHPALPAKMIAEAVAAMMPPAAAASRGTDHARRDAAPRQRPGAH